jgi:DNA-binding NtrC family response regulator
MSYFNQLKEFKTLLVDDDDLIRDSLSIAFTNKGCFLQTAETAEDGLRALKEAQFDIIISDLRLPGKDGLEFFRSVRNLHPDILCVLITAYGDANIATKASAMGIHDFVEKPFSVETLVQSLASMVTVRR